MSPNDPPDPPDPRDVVVEFMHAANEHDESRALAMLHPEFRFREEGSEGFLDRDEMVDLLGWDRVIGSEAHSESMEAEGNVVTGIFWETNALYRRLGMETTRCHLTFRVADGLIREQKIEQRDEEAFMAALEPFLEWAEEVAPEELAAIQPGGEFVFSAEMAGRWLHLLDRWRAETGGADREDSVEDDD